MAQHTSSFRTATPSPTANKTSSGARLMVTALAAGVCAVVLIFAIFAVYQDYFQRRIQRGEVESYLESISSSTAWGIDNWLADRIYLAQVVAERIANAPPDTNIFNILKSDVFQKVFVWTYYGKANGSYFGWPTKLESLPGNYDPRLRPWYKTGEATDTPTLTEPYHDIASNAETITAVAPVYKSGRLAGVVGADFSTDSLTRLLAQPNLRGLGYAFIVSGKGKILAFPDENMIGRPAAAAFPGQKLELNGQIQFVGEGENAQIIKFVKLPSLKGVDWRLGVAIDKNKAYASLREFRASVSIATLAAVLLMVVVLGVVLHRLLVRPLMNARVAADSANAAKSEFLASMSHEIRTPMNGVLGMAEVLMNSELSERQKELANIIVSSGHALLTVINDILDFSKLEAGKLRLSPRSFNFRETVFEVATMMQPRMLEKDLELIVRYATDIPEGIVADEARLRQVLANLIGNAVKFTECGHVLVDVSGERRGDQVVLQVGVTDTGIGISPEELPRMFQRFEQADASHTRRFGGTGLGLAICKNIVELMGGEIGADSELGAGSRFWFEFSAPVDDKIKPFVDAQTRIFEDVRLLVVDDNATNRRVIEELVDNWNMRAVLVDGGAAAFTALERSQKEDDPFKAILMDHRMPEEDGVSLTRRIQKDPRFASIPVIMLSSFDGAQANSPPDGVRFAAHLYKPVRPSQLVDLLARVLADRSTASLKKIVKPPEKPRVEAAPTENDGRTKLLFAEDNVVNQLVAKNMVDCSRYEIIIAEHGEAAVNLFLERQPDLILMDLSMPVMDGFEATKCIREIEAERHLPRTPIIAATAHVLDEDHVRCRDAGMDDFLSKPMRKEQLAEILERWSPPDKIRKSA